MVAVTIGNSASKVQGQAQYWRWKFYVSGCVSFIDRVLLGLHPTFPEPIRELQPPYELTMRSWGTFPISVHIDWKGGGILTVVWHLQFGKDDERRSFQVPDAVVSRVQNELFRHTSPYQVEEVAKVREIFRRHNARGDGRLSFDELESVIETMGAGTRNLRQVFSAMDTDADGHVSIDEFLHYIFASKSEATNLRAKAGATPVGCAKDILRCGDIRLVKGLTMQKRKGAVMRHQDIPLSDFVPKKDAASLLSELMGIIVVSYGWLSRDHPDPQGFHLATVQKYLALHLNQKRYAGVFWDYCSLPQEPRQEADQVQFRRAIQGINLLYGARMTTVVKLTQMPTPQDGTVANLTPYELRGWCIFEEAVSGIVKHGSWLLDLGAVDDALYSTRIQNISKTAVSRREPPLHPDDFASRLETAKFTNGADKSLVTHLYRQFFSDVCAKAKEVSFSRPWNWTSHHNSWGPTQATQLGKSLPAFVSCESLLLHGHCDLGSGVNGALDLAQAFTALPHLRMLLLSDCGLTDRFLQHLASRFEEMHLEILWLDGNPLTGDGLQVVAERLGEAPGLRELRLPAACQPATQLVTAWRQENKFEDGLMWC